ncbi:MAG TPA: family 1 glycosylhydrolase [Candidatus Corynebacterium gallistercoris]|uniref:Family 1 glycosylhydrolase n=1 Tax=Candidatus Corynebacterium gallistercoris TaxID=2838530 RepID=A0A9D1URD7_9CORY|nr:family 1 glycosylhydrolase [Candidatus Corynebacterium gallistercoris]
MNADFPTPSATDLKGMALGTASASMQIESVPQPSNWSHWAAQPGTIADGSTPVRTTDHWQRWEEDNQIMDNLGLQIARVSVEWARIEPRPGQFDEEVLTRYREEFSDLRHRGIGILLTLHHFSHPLWFEESGAFREEHNVDVFLRFVRKVVEHLGDIVDDWITINEPNVYATEAHLFGATPPGRGGHLAVRETIRNLALAHLRTYRYLHDTLDGPKRTVRVTFAHHKRVFTPMNKFNPIHRALTHLAEWLFQTALEPAFYEARFHPIIGTPRNLDILPAGSPAAPNVYTDAIAINYYSRTAVAGLKDATLPNKPINDLGWEIYPPGIVQVSAPLAQRYRLPVWITENGTADNQERFRCQFILDHLEQLAHAPVTVERYYHWCLVDNWEWSEGMIPKFGLVALDENTLERTLKPAATMMQEIIAAGAITEDIRRRYRQDYPTRATATPGT